MLPVGQYFLLLGIVINVKAVCLFHKHYHKKITAENALIYPVKGVLHCEKLCLELGDSCKAVNVLSYSGKYQCEVMKEFPYTDDQVQDKMINNDGGKLIIKQGRPFSLINLFSHYFK